MNETRDGGDASLADKSFEAEELAAEKTAFYGRVITLCLIAVLITVIVPWPAPLYFYGLLALFLILGIADYRTARAPWRRSWHRYAFVTADFVLLSFTMIYPNPLVMGDLPPPVGLRFGGFIYFFVLLAALTYLYRPGLMLWGGISAAVSWFIGIAWLLSLPDTVWMPPTSDDLNLFLALLADPNFIDLHTRAQEVSVLLITAGLLAAAVSRARAIALRRADLAGERANLARYFPRKTVDMLARKTSPLLQAREGTAAVLFTDIIAFTAWSEKQSPRALIAVMRQMHGLLTEIVFKHDGTLDKFIGDGLMATFGTPEPTGRDAVNALAAAIDMADAFETWRAGRPVEDGGGLRLAVGVHYGPIVMGDIGIPRRMEFAVLGDTVNVASRLENANRDFGSRCVISADLVEAARSQSPEMTARLLAGLRPHAPIGLRGHSQKMPILVLP